MTKEEEAICANCKHPAWIHAGTICLGDPEGDDSDDCDCKAYALSLGDEHDATEMTNVQQMTDEELSRWIAEKLEPLSERGDAKEYVIHWGIAKGTKCWQTMRTGMVADVTDDTIHWWARDMVNDPAMSMMLLEKLVVARGFVSMSAWISSPMRVCVTGQIENGYWKSDEPSTYAASDKIGRCICEAYALSLGDEPK